MKKSWTVYRHTSPSGKVYIGITCQKLQYRWGVKGKNYLLNVDGKYRHPLFARAILKYGWDNIVHEVLLEGVSKSEADYAEKYLIKWYKLHNISYNVTEGGDGVIGIKRTEEQRKQHSKALKEWYKTHESAMLGRHHSDESRLKIKANHRHHQSAITRKRISEAQTGKTFPQWRKTLLSNAHSNEKIAVVQLTKDNQYITTYNSIMDAQRATGIHNAAIAGAVRRKGSAKGFKWLKKQDYDNQNFREDGRLFPCNV